MYGTINHCIISQLFRQLQNYVHLLSQQQKKERKKDKKENVIYLIINEIRYFNNTTIINSFEIQLCPGLQANSFKY